jgi:hypothetical protein
MEENVSKYSFYVLLPVLRSEWVRKMKKNLMGII